MSDATRRIVTLYVDVDNARLVSSINSINLSPVNLYRRSQTLMQCHLRLADGTTYFTPPAGAQWLFVADTSFAASHADLVVSTNAQFNIAADWSGISVVGGKICWRVDTATDLLTTAMADAATLAGYGELWMIAPGENPSLIVQFSITFKGIVGDVGADSALVYTQSNLLKFDGDDVVLLFPDGSVAQRWSRT